jgi:hypothetical protein
MDVHHYDFMMSEKKKRRRKEKLRTESHAKDHIIGWVGPAVVCERLERCDT